MSMRSIRLAPLVCLLMPCLLVSTGIAHGNPADNTISVITYNIRYANPGDGLDVWPHRTDAVAKMVNAGDLVGLQEVTYSQLVDLQDRLPDFEHYGVGRDDGKRGGEFSPIFYRRDRFEVIAKGTFWLSETPDQVGSKGWDAALPRICTWMVLADKSTGSRLWIANTHFDHRGQRARLESGKLIVDTARKGQIREAVIVLGDFNATPGSPPYDALTSTSSESDFQLFDARQRSSSRPTGPQSTWNGFKEIVPDRIIDHVFVNDLVEVQQLETLDPKTSAGRFASDHLPVRVTVRLPVVAVEPGE